MIRQIRNKVCLLLVLLASAVTAFASQNEEKAFSPGDFVFGHIRNAYAWHVTAIGGHHVSVPLPVIVKSQEHGWCLFSSSRIPEDGATFTYAGATFRLSEQPAQRGRLVEIIDGGEVRPWDFSITKNVFEILLSATILLVIFLLMARFYRRNPRRAPGGFLGCMEVIVLFVINEVIKPCIGKGYERYTPYLLTAFFFILVNNILGLIPIFPGGANVTGNLAVTSVLAVITFVFVNVFATKDYWKDIFLVPAAPMWLKCPVPLMPLLEFIGVFTKPLALMIRLFANILAGHIIELVFMALIFMFGAITPALGAGVGVFSVLFALAMQILEVLVVFLQAYVFTLLSAVFIGLAQVHEHAEAHESA